MQSLEYLRNVEYACCLKNVKGNETVLCKNLRIESCC